VARSLNENIFMFYLHGTTPNNRSELYGMPKSTRIKVVLIGKVLMGFELLT
jgi:hypothetical protein